jgi:hypothetical protein
MTGAELENGWVIVNDPRHGSSYILQNKKYDLEAFVKFDGCVDISPCDRNADQHLHICNLAAFIHAIIALHDSASNLFDNEHGWKNKTLQANKLLNE